MAQTMLRRATGMLSRLVESRSYKLPDHLSLFELALDDNVLEQIPESIARENCVLPIETDGERLTCVTPNDTNICLQDKLRFILNRNVQFLWREATEVQSAIDFYYGQVEGESADSMLQEFTDTAIDFTETACADEPQLVGAFATSKTPINAESLRERLLAHNRASRTNRRNNQTIGDGFMFYTIPEGQRVLAHRNNGKIDTLIGPKRVWKGRSRFLKMKHHVAHPSQYLTVCFRDGQQQVMLGPCELWEDPRIHASIHVNECLDLAAKEAVVVYRSTQDDDDSKARRIVHGPGLFVPNPGEWLHRFSWHSSHGIHKQPDALQFQKLCMMPDQMYHDVEDVRTADDAVLTIRLMIFFELIDIDRMLDSTLDPIGDFINAATSDVVEFTGKLSFEAFKQQTELLNELASYQKLLHRAEQCGYKINNVVYRGYGAPASLQKMHDEAIQSRTRLQLERATEEQAQDVEDYKLRCQVDRSSQRRKEQKSEIEHDMELKRIQAEFELKNTERKESFNREQIRAQEELQLEMRRLSAEQTQSHLAALQGMEVDLTKYLTQARADQVIEIRGNGQAAPELHLPRLETSD